MVEKTLVKCKPGEPCPIERALQIIGSKWTFLIIRDLLIDDSMRFSELQRSLQGISPKTLALRLRELEKEGIVNRTVYAEIPPRVEYSLTPRGRALESILFKLKVWGQSLLQ